MTNIEQVQKAIQLTSDGKFREAEELYKKLISESPNEPVLLSAFGLFYISINDFERALYYLQHACDLQKTAGTLSAYGFTLYKLREYNKAAEVLEETLNYGENADIYNHLVLSLFEIKNYKKAIAYTEKMNKLYPDNAKSVANMVKSLTHTGKLLEAEKICADYLKEHTDSPLLWYHLGLLKELIYSDEEKAIECYKISGELGNLNSDYNTAVAYQKLCNFESAEKYYKKFLATFPDNIDGKTSLGMCYLTQKKFKEGYDLFYERDKGHTNRLTQNFWEKGTPIENNLVIICDQGYGDQIQFIRYLPLLKNKKVKVAADNKLADLFKQNYPDAEFINYSEVDSNIQAIRVTDLAYALNMDFDNIPYSEGYLKAVPAEISCEKQKIGLCWEAGAAGIRGMINRTINIKCFEPLFDIPNIQVYSFQYIDSLGGNEKYPQMINLAKDFRNFSDTAKALKSMDMVITVDTVIAHLAGALGIKTCLLLPYAADWRWFRTGNYEDTKTPWYKSITVLQQKDHISWEEPIGKVINLLK